MLTGRRESCDIDIHIILSPGFVAHCIPVGICDTGPQVTTLEFGRVLQVGALSILPCSYLPFQGPTPAWPSRGSRPYIQKNISRETC